MELKLNDWTMAVQLCDYNNNYYHHYHSYFLHLNILIFRLLSVCNRALWREGAGKSHSHSHSAEPDRTQWESKQTRTEGKRAGERGGKGWGERVMEEGESEWERGWECVCVREREREDGSLCVWEREIEEMERERVSAVRKLSDSVSV